VYIEQYYQIPKEKKKSVILAIKKHKLRLKRDYAKLRISSFDDKYKPEENPNIV
jgi:hypothetical protein